MGDRDPVDLKGQKYVRYYLLCFSSFLNLFVFWVFCLFVDLLCLVLSLPPQVFLSIFFSLLFLCVFLTLPLSPPPLFSLLQVPGCHSVYSGGRLLFRILQFAGLSSLDYSSYYIIFDANIIIIKYLFHFVFHFLGSFETKSKWRWWRPEEHYIRLF